MKVQSNAIDREQLKTILDGKLRQADVLERGTVEDCQARLDGYEGQTLDEIARSASDTADSRRDLGNYSVGVAGGLLTATAVAARVDSPATAIIFALGSGAWGIGSLCAHESARAHAGVAEALPRWGAEIQPGPTAPPEDELVQSLRHEAQNYRGAAQHSHDVNRRWIGAAAGFAGALVASVGSGSPLPVLMLAGVAASGLGALTNHVEAEGNRAGAELFDALATVLKEAPPEPPKEQLLLPAPPERLLLPAPPELKLLPAPKKDAA